LRQKKTKRIENRSELQNLNFEPGEGPVQMTGAANGVLSSGKDLYHVDASDSRVFATQIRTRVGMEYTSLLAEAIFLVFADGRKETSAMGRKWL